MSEIEIIGSFGNEKKTIRIGQSHGAGGIYHISTNYWHDGEIIKTQHFGWHYRINKKSWISSDDITIIIESIEKK
ncbi:MAG: hypothetical protein ACHQ1D_03040 [Nitrososphaerales archaeon]